MKEFPGRLRAVTECNGKFHQDALHVIQIHFYLYMNCIFNSYDFCNRILFKLKKFIISKYTIKVFYEKIFLRQFFKQVNFDIFSENFYISS